VTVAPTSGGRPVTRTCMTSIAFLGFLFLSSKAPTCYDAADADDNGRLELTDAIYALTYLFLGGPSPPEPFTACGKDVTESELDCDGFAACP